MFISDMTSLVFSIRRLLHQRFLTVHYETPLGDPFPSAHVPLLELVENGLAAYLGGEVVVAGKLRRANPSARSHR